MEDATEALGATLSGRQAGMLGDAGCYSFNGNKLMTTGGGLTSLGLGGTWSSTGGIVPEGESGYRSLFGGSDTPHHAAFQHIEQLCLQRQR